MQARPLLAGRWLHSSHSTLQCRSLLLDVVLSALELPDVTFPDVILSAVGLPDITLPDVILHDVALPDVVLPDALLPGAVLLGLVQTFQVQYASQLHAAW